MEKVLMSWSGGKDCAVALHETLKSRKYEVSALLTTLTEDYDRVSMHGVRRVLLEQQAESIGLPLEKVYITKNASNEEYEARMREVLARHKEAGMTAVVFGDIFLEDLRKYREDKLATLGLNAIFPIWKRDTRGLALSLAETGFRAIVTCVDTQALDGRFAGRRIDAQFMAELPAGVDPCGENGEFHSFVYDGPIFKSPVSFTTGETVLRENRFCFCDLLPV